MAKGLIVGGILGRLFVTSQGFDRLADVLGFIMIGILVGFIVGVFLFATLTYPKQIVPLRVGLVAGVLSVALIFIGIQRKNRAIDETMRQNLEPRQTTAPAANSPAQAPPSAINPPVDPFEYKQTRSPFT